MKQMTAHLFRAERWFNVCKSNHLLLYNPTLRSQGALVVQLFLQFPMLLLYDVKNMLDRLY